MYRHTDVQCARRRTMASAHAQSGMQEGGLVAQQQRKSKWEKLDKIDELSL